MSNTNKHTVAALPAIAASIILRATEDYRLALIENAEASNLHEAKIATKHVKALEDFFRSEWASHLMSVAGCDGVSPEIIIGRFRAMEAHDISPVFYDISIDDMLMI